MQVGNLEVDLPPLSRTVCPHDAAALSEVGYSVRISDLSLVEDTKAGRTTSPVLDLPEQCRLSLVGHPVTGLLAPLADLPRAPERGRAGLVGRAARIAHETGEHVQQLAELLIIRLRRLVTW